MSILAAAPLNRGAEALYEKLARWLHPLETSGRHPDDIVVPDHGEQIAIFGMGRVGLSTYKFPDGRYPGRGIAFDRDPNAVERHREQTRNVVLADATDADFWNQVKTRAHPFELVVLAMPKHSVNLHAA
ncbi:MAG: NAD-binding protein [Candidatus Synoicihabitans palmerolidicus]|nr:NAD-binding protein [Candidatus Synoicihabitans palmerolidicus]